MTVAPCGPALRSDSNRNPVDPLHLGPRLDFELISILDHADGGDGHRIAIERRAVVAKRIAPVVALMPVCSG